MIVPNLPGLACHLDAGEAHVADRRKTRCGRVVPYKYSRVTDDRQRVNCRQCRRAMRKEA